MRSELVVPFSAFMVVTGILVVVNVLQFSYYYARYPPSKPMTINKIQQMEDGQIWYRLKLEGSDIDFHSTNIYQIGDKLKIVKE